MLGSRMTELPPARGKGVPGHVVVRAGVALLVVERVLTREHALVGALLHELVRPDEPVHEVPDGREAGAGVRLLAPAEVDPGAGGQARVDEVLGALGILRVRAVARVQEDDAVRCEMPVGLHEIARDPVVRLENVLVLAGDGIELRGERGRLEVRQPAGVEIRLDLGLGLGVRIDGRRREERVVAPAALVARLPGAAAVRVEVEEAVPGHRTQRREPRVARLPGPDGVTARVLERPRELVHRRAGLAVGRQRVDDLAGEVGDGEADHLRGDREHGRHNHLAPVRAQESKQASEDHAGSVAPSL